MIIDLAKINSINDLVNVKLQHIKHILPQSNIFGKYPVWRTFWLKPTYSWFCQDIIHYFMDISVTLEDNAMQWKIQNTDTRPVKINTEN